MWRAWEEEASSIHLESGRKKKKKKKGTEARMGEWGGGGTLRKRGGNRGKKDSLGRFDLEGNKVRAARFKNGEKYIL